MLIHRSSLSETVDAVNEAVFFGHATTAKDRRHVARWIAARQGLPGAYGELFAGFAPELASGIRLFTGERVTSASARHILGEESCRALLLLKSDDAIATAALARATAWIVERVEKAATLSPRNNAAHTAAANARSGCGGTSSPVGSIGKINGCDLDCRSSVRCGMAREGGAPSRSGTRSSRWPKWIAPRRAASCDTPRHASGQRRSGRLARPRLPDAATRSPAPRSNDSDV
jgi:hypothetical protein